MMATEIIQHHPGAVDAAPAAPEAGVSDLVRLAIERGVDVEVLERLVALQERVTERNARAAFFEALASFQEECPEIPKSATAKIATRKGGAYSYSFAPLEAITRTIRPILRRHGLSYSWDVEPGQGGLHVVCVLRHIEGHEERAMFPVPTGTDAAMSEAQKHGAALTYGKRQSLTSVLGLTTADPDADSPAGRPSSSETISDRQAADLSALIDEVGVDRQRFLRWLGVSDLAQLRASDYSRAVNALERKRGDS